MVNIIKNIKENKEIKNTFIYLLSTFLTKGVSFVIIPILTNIISIEEFGTLSLFESYLNITCALILFSTPNYIAKYYYNESDVSSKIKHSLLINFIITLLLILVLILLSVIGNIKLPVYVFLSLPILGLFNSILETYLLLLRLNIRPLEYLKLEIFKLFMDTILLLSLVIIFNLGWLSKFYSIVLVSIILFVFCYYKISQLINFDFKFNLNELKNTFYFLFPLIIHSISFTLINSYDKIALERYSSLEDVAIYSVYTKFISVSIIIIIGINKAFHPKLYELLSNNYSIIFKKNIQYLIVFLCITVSVVGVVVDFFDSYVIPVEYLRGAFLIPFFCLSFMFYGIYSIIFPIIISKGNNLYLMSFSLFCAISNIVINNLLVGPLGMYGAVLGTLFSFFCLFLSTGIYSFNLVRVWRENI
jgi:O-antigen/teichoic acid export membrane protein